MLAACLAMPAQAAEIPPQLYELGDVVVADRYLPSPAGTHYEVTREDFERTHARTLDEALTMIPSINVRNGADGTPRLDVRGLRTRQIKLLVNGIPINSADDGQFDPTLIPTFAIGLIELQAGASSVLYGDGGMGGVLDIQTRGGFRGWHSGVTAELGSDHFWNTHGHVGYGDGTSELFVAAGVKARDGFPLSDDFDAAIAPASPNFEDGGMRENSDHRRVNVVTSMSRQVSDALRLGMFVSHVEGRYGKPPTVFLNSSDEFASAARFERTDDQRGTSLQLGADYDPGGNWTGRLWWYANRLSEELTGYDDAGYDSIVRRNAYTEDDRTRVHGVRGEYHVRLPATGARLGVSLDRRNEAFDARGVSCDNARPNRNQTCSLDSTTVSSNTLNDQIMYSAIAVDRDVTVTSLAAEVSQPLPYDLLLVAGVGRHLLDKDGGSDSNAGSAQLGLSKPLSPVSTLYGSVARKVDAPSIRQLYDARSGNDALGFQRADHLELGVKNRWARAALEAALYQARVHDFIERDETSDRYRNRQTLLFRGLDVSGRLQASDALELRAGLGLLHARDESSDAVSDTLQYRPRHKLTLEADYLLRGNWMLSGSYRRVGGQAHFSRTEPAVHRNLDSFELVSARVSYLLPSERGALYAGVDNLFDEDYATSYGFPQAGRFIYSGVRLQW